MAMETPHQLSYFQPAEWAPHSAVWLAWPSAADLWEDNLLPAQREFAGLCRAISPEKIEILVSDEKAEKSARVALDGISTRFHTVSYGDIWLRDTAPLFVINPNGKVATVQFAFNGWGGKYVLNHDSEVSRKIAEACEKPTFICPWILEGGSIESDGEGTAMTSRQCLLSSNRNPKMNQKSIEEGLKDYLGIKTVLWLSEGLINDHTDGHIDTIARFTAPGKVVCMVSVGQSDPNARVLNQIKDELSSFKDSKGRPLSVATVPSPGEVLDEDNNLMPASYLNFYIANESVIVPTYGSVSDSAAVNAIAKLFPSRKTVGLSARAILSGGGAFHCITQQEPQGAR